MVTANRISGSCGFGVPLYEFKNHRPQLPAWADRKGRERLTAYQAQKNASSIDGLPAVTWLKNVALSLLLLACLAAGCSAHAPSRAAMTNRDVLVGTWRVVSYETWNAQGEVSTPFGNEPSGYAVFDPTGHAFIQLMRTPPIPPFASPQAPTPEEIRGAHSAFAAYYGPYTVDAAVRTITIRVEGSNMPSYTGTNQVRPFRVEGETLTFGVPGQYQATLVKVRTRQGELAP